MVGVAQLVRVPDCGSEGRGFESHLPPKQENNLQGCSLFLYPPIKQKSRVIIIDARLQTNLLH